MKIISRKEAIALKLKLFYTGEKCKRGHISQRYVNGKECAECVEQYRKENTEKVEQHEVNKKQYAKKNAKKNAKDRKQYHKQHHKQYYASPALFKTYAHRLIGHKCKETKNGKLLVQCKLCSEWFSPTILQTHNRVKAINGTAPGATENNLYCSDTCKNACPLFNFKTGRQIDPNSSKFIPKTKQQKARRCQTNHLKQNQCDATGGSSYCEECGDFVDIELHHNDEIAKCGMEAVNSANHELLCWRCHKKRTK